MVTAELEPHVADKKPPKKSAPAPKPEPEGRKPMVVQMRGSEDWKLWIEDLAAAENDTVAKFLERLARKHAKETGFREMPKR